MDRKKKINKIINTGILISLCGILICEIDSMKSIIRAIVLWMQRMISLICPIDIAGVISVQYTILEIISICIFLICIAGHIAMFCMFFFNDLRIHYAKGIDPYEQHLLYYLNGNSTGRCFLVSGVWGSGKTYAVNEFFKKYYSFSQRKIYRISCFGLSDRNDVVREINDTIEQNDYSFSSMVIRTMSIIPVVGELLNSLLKKEYDYRSVNKKSIFIFDDFERITARVAQVPSELQKPNNPITTFNKTDDSQLSNGKLRAAVPAR